MSGESKTPINWEEVGVRVKQVREARGLSGHQFAKQLGVSQSHISVVERGAEPSTRLLVALSSSLGISIDWLLTGVEATPAPVAERERRQPDNAVEGELRGLAAAIAGAPMLMQFVGEERDVGPVSDPALRRAIGLVRAVYKSGEPAKVMALEATLRGLATTTEEQFRPATEDAGAGTKKSNTA